MGKIVLLAAMLVTTTALADQVQVNGTIMASEAEPGARGIWRYEMRVTWDNASEYALNHLNLKLDDGSNCSREDIMENVRWENPVGTAQCFGVNGLIYFDAQLNMDGDPSLSIYVPVLQFVPNHDSQVRPGRSGVAVMTFWSDLHPWPIDEPNGLISEQFGPDHAFGRVDGVFPALPCNPIAAEECSWGSIKSSYGR